MDAVPASSRLAGAYAGVVVLWSTTPLAVIISLQILPPLWAVSVRTWLAAVIAWLLVRAGGRSVPFDRKTLPTYWAGALAMYGAMLFTYLSARTISSGLIAVLFGLSPLLVGVLSALLGRSAQVGMRRVLALLVALSGLVLIFLPQQGAKGLSLIGVGFCLLGVLAYVISSLWLSAIPVHVTPLQQTAGSLMVSAFCFGLTLLALDPHLPPFHPQLSGWVALLWSVIGGSILAMILCFWLLRHLPASTVALSTMVTPVIALTLGALVRGERMAPQVALGASLILVGLVLYHLREILALREPQRRITKLENSPVAEDSLTST